MARRNKNSVYLQAAKIAASPNGRFIKPPGHFCRQHISHDDGACVIISVLRGDPLMYDYLCDERKAFEDMFKPSRKRYYTAYWLEASSDEESQQQRVIALLLAHAMHLTGDMP